MMYGGRDSWDFVAEWGMKIRYRDSYTPEGNWIAEQCHCTIKRIAARMQCSIQEAVY